MFVAVCFLMGEKREAKWVPLQKGMAEEVMVHLSRDSVCPSGEVKLRFIRGCGGLSARNTIPFL